MIYEHMFIKCVIILSHKLMRIFFVRYFKIRSSNEFKNTGNTWFYIQVRFIKVQIKHFNYSERNPFQL